MIFFKKKSKKITEKFKEIKPTSPSQSVEPVKRGVLPSIPTNEQQIKRENEKWLELNIPGDFSSSFNIPQFSSIQEGTSSNSTANTIDTCSTSTIDIPTDFDAIIRNTETSVSSHSKKDFELPSDAVEEQESLEIINVDKVSISSSDKNQNAGDSLAYSEGETKIVPEKQENTLPIHVEAIPEMIIHTEKLYSIEKGDKIVVNSDIFIDEEDTVLEEENTPCLGNDQLLLEQIHPTTLNEQEIIESPTLLPTNIIENKEIKIEEEKEKETDLPTKTHQSDKQLPQLEARSETVGSLEIASHQQEIDITLKQDLFLPEVNEIAIKETEEKNITKVCLVQQCDTEKTTLDDTSIEKVDKVDMVVKRKSGHSLIPRKHYTTSVIENAPVAIVSKAPASSATSDVNTKRRGSSGSFIPTFQQNRLSLIITETNDKNWSPSTSSDSLPKSPSSIISSISTSSSGSSVTRRKEKRSSLKAHRLSNIPNVSQQSKIPVAGLNMSPNNIPKALPSSASNIGSISKLPKRNTTFI